jgi:hypothetical protein
MLNEIESYLSYFEDVVRSDKSKISGYSERIKALKERLTSLTEKLSTKSNLHSFFMLNLNPNQLLANKNNSACRQLFPQKTLVLWARFFDATVGYETLLACISPQLLNPVSFDSTELNP